MSNLLEEIEDDYAYHFKVKVFKRILLIAAILTFLAIIFFVNYTAKQEVIKQQNAQIMRVLLQASNITNSADNLDGANVVKQKAQLAEKIAQGGDNSFVNLAKLQLVGYNLTEKNYQEACAILLQIIDSRHASAILQSYARIMFVLIVLDYPDLDSTKRLEEFAGKLEAANAAFLFNGKLAKALYYIKEDKKHKFLME
jgi:hypothetical protein